MEKTIFGKIVNTATHATKEFLGLGNNVISTSLNSSNYSRDVPFGKSGWMFDFKGNMDVHFNFSGLTDVVKAYETCAPVFSIINKQAYAFVNGKTKILNKKGKDADNDWAKKVKKLMKRPNPLQNWKQFEAQAAIYLRLFGYCPIITVKPNGFPHEDATDMWIVPPYLCKFKFSTGKYWDLKKGWIESITITYGTEKTVITDMDRFIILKDITPGFDNIVLPSSPIQPLRQNINNLIGIYDSKGVLINYRGALGILTPELDPAGAITADPKENLEMERKLMGLGIRSGQAKFILASSALKWQQIGIPYKDLMLTEWAQDDTQIICDALVYPYKLLSANSASSSMNGNEIGEFKKQLYDDFVIPFAEMIYEQLDEAFHAEEHNCTITKDYSHVKVLQEDGLKKAQTTKVRNDGTAGKFFNNIITLKRYSEIMEEDTPPEPQASMYYNDLVKAGWIFGQQSKAPGNDNPKEEEEEDKIITGEKVMAVKCPKCLKLTKDAEPGKTYVVCEHCEEVII